MSDTDDEVGFASPEEASLATYPPAANARVIRVDRKGHSHAVVVIETDPPYRYFIHVSRVGDLWYEEDDHN